MVLREPGSNPCRNLVFFPIFQKYLPNFGAAKRLQWEGFRLSLSFLSLNLANVIHTWSFETLLLELLRDPECCSATPGSRKNIGTDE